MNPRPRKLRSRRARQEGAALLIVLFVLMMATTTAVYSLSSTQFEVRAAGALRQSMRARFVSEAATTGVIAYCNQENSSGCMAIAQNLDSSQRQAYALPNTASESVWLVKVSDYKGTGFYDVFLPNDAYVTGVDTTGGGIAGTWTPTFVSTIERSVMKTSNGAPVYRAVVSTYGTLDYDANRDAVADETQRSSELRLDHSTISTTRAFLDLP